MRRAAKRDSNEQAIVDALEQVGAVVQRISDSSALDLMIGYRGSLFWAEVKDGDKSASRQKLTAGQVETLRKFAGYKVGVINSVDAALEMIGVRV